MDDCEQIDKRMSREIEAIYSDPARHKFLSCHDYLTSFGITYTVHGRLGKVTASNTVCWYCGKLQPGHAEKDEQL